MVSPVPSPPLQSRQNLGITSLIITNWRKSLPETKKFFRRSFSLSLSPYYSICELLAIPSNHKESILFYPISFAAAFSDTPSFFETGIWSPSIVFKRSLFLLWELSLWHSGSWVFLKHSTMVENPMIFIHLFWLGKYQNYWSFFFITAFIASWV